MAPVKCALSYSCVPPPMGAVGVTLKDRGLIFHRAMFGLTAIVMVTSEVCACIMRPASTRVIISPHPVALCSVEFVANNIPFLSLNLSIVLEMLANIVLNVTAYSNEATGIQFSTILARRQENPGHWTLDM